MKGESQIFVATALREGYTAPAAEAALASLAAQLADRGLVAPRYFCFRSGGGSGGGAPEPPARPRLLLLFPSADDALSFAQRRGLGRSPRLVPLSLAQALAALLQRPAIGALLVVGAGADPPGLGLPAGLRIARADLVALLAPDTP